MSEALDRVLIQRNENLSIGLLDKAIPFSLGAFSFLLAWYLQGCFNLNFPVAYDGGDAAFMSWLIKRVVDGGWYFHSAYSGFPFGSTFLDFPSSDSGNFLVIKLLAVLTHRYALTLNLYFLLGFSVTSLVSYFVLQKLGFDKIYAITGAILFVFLPFHFMRLAHLFYTWYFCVPVYVWFAFKIFSNVPLFFDSRKRNGEKKIKSALTLLILSSFGVYYAFFSVIMLVASGIAGSLKWKSHKNIVSAFLALCIITAGVAINIAPTFVYAYKHGRNHEVSRRSPLESETYGLKLVQMLLPQPAHRLHSFAEITAKYQSFPLVNENVTSCLGLIGSIGLIVLLVVAVGTPFFRFTVDSRLQLLAFLTIVLFLFATIGGFAPIFSALVSPMIRAWNRVSVFIGFISITAFLLCTEKLLKNVAHLNALRFFSVCSGLFLIGFGVWDQVGHCGPGYATQVKNQFLIDQHFVQKIEQTIPKGAVYQLPYVPFPEGLIITSHYFFLYDFLRAYLHSSTLHWSSGGMKGRAGDLFFRHLAEQPLAQQVKTIKSLGFNGIYIDRRGYEDRGANIEKELIAIIGKKELVSENNNLSFFPV